MISLDPDARWSKLKLNERLSVEARGRDACGDTRRGALNSGPGCEHATFYIVENALKERMPRLIFVGGNNREGDRQFADQTLQR